MELLSWHELYHAYSFSLPCFLQVFGAKFCDGKPAPDANQQMSLAGFVVSLSTVASKWEECIAPFYVGPVSTVPISERMGQEK